MAKCLDVYFHEKKVGQLTQNNYGEISFAYLSTWLDDQEAISISCSLPLQKEPFNKKDCQAFFGGLLPEENQRKLIAKNLGISAQNDFSMLEKIGGECAGALSFISSEEKLQSKENDYFLLTENALSKILRELQVKPLLAGEEGVRLSLAGVQDKLAVYCQDEKFFIPLNNSPSTHILKPDFQVYEGVVFNEAFCLKLAKQIGLSVAEADIKKVDDIYYLFVKRYDRILLNEKVMRLHQEDFCQALNVSSNNKYQNEGGPSLKECFELIRKVSESPVIDLNRMIDAVIFNYLIGNCDAHGKNFSILYNNELQLAPLYDLICTLYYPELSQKMAMKIGGEYKITRIKIEHFEYLAKEIHFAAREVRRRVREVIDQMMAALPQVLINHPVQEKIAALIKSRCLNMALSC